MPPFQHLALSEGPALVQGFAKNLDNIGKSGNRGHPARPGNGITRPRTRSKLALRSSRYLARRRCTPLRDHIERAAGGAR